MESEVNLRQMAKRELKLAKRWWMKDTARKGVRCEERIKEDNAVLEETGAV